MARDDDKIIKKIIMPKKIFYIYKNKKSFTLIDFMNQIIVTTGRCRQESSLEDK